MWAWIHWFSGWSVSFEKLPCVNGFKPKLAKVVHMYGTLVISTGLY